MNETVRSVGTPRQQGNPPAAPRQASPDPATPFTLPFRDAEFYAIPYDDETPGQTAGPATLHATGVVVGTAFDGFAVPGGGPGRATPAALSAAGAGVGDDVYPGESPEKPRLLMALAALFTGRPSAMRPAGCDVGPEAEDRWQGGVCPPATDSVTLTLDFAPATLPAYDRADALDRLDDDEVLLERVAGFFAYDVNQRVEQLREAIQGGNASLVRVHCHSLRGAANMAGAMAFGDLARRMGLAARQGTWVAVCRNLAEMEWERQRFLAAFGGVAARPPTPGGDRAGAEA